MKKRYLFSLILLILISLHSIKIQPKQVTLICSTPDPEITSAYIALTSIMPKGDIRSVKHTRILEGHIKSNHWSALEHEYMTVKIETSRAIAPQLFRHRSFTFQQFSQTYANTVSLIEDELPIPDLRFKSANKHFAEGEREEIEKRIATVFAETLKLYKDLVAIGIKTECARFVLPEITPTIVIMTGNIRSWIHFIENRSRSRSQKEMLIIVEECREIFKEVFPNVYQYLKKTRSNLGWR